MNQEKFIGSQYSVQYNNICGHIIMTTFVIEFCTLMGILDFYLKASTRFTLTSNKVTKVENRIMYTTYCVHKHK